MKIYTIGTKVKLACGIQAVISSVTIFNENYLEYGCVWWDGKNRKSANLEEHEIVSVVKGSHQTIGFK